MNKVMTRANHHPGARPPGRRDPRRPGGAPPRAPGGGTPRTTTPDGRTPGAPSTGATPTHTSPPDNRPRTTSRAPGTPTPTRPTTAAAWTTNATTAGPTTALRPHTPTTPPSRRNTSPAVPSPSPRRPIPQPRPTDLFADRLLAVLSGRRPVHWMLRHTAGRAYDELAWLAERGPLRATGSALPVVRDIGYYVPRAGAIEAFARIGAGEQLHAMAFRLEQGHDLRWRCTAVELGGPRRPHTDDD